MGINKYLIATKKEALDILTAILPEDVVNHILSFIQSSYGSFRLKESLGQDSVPRCPRLFSMDRRRQEDAFQTAWIAVMRGRSR